MSNRIGPIMDKYASEQMATYAASQLTQGATKDSPFEALHQAVEHLHSARKRAAEIADRLVGAAGPEEAGGVDAKLVREGLVGTVQDASDTIHSIANRIMDDMARIERRL